MARPARISSASLLMKVSMLVFIKVLFQNGVDIEKHRTICLLGQSI